MTLLHCTPVPEGIQGPGSLQYHELMPWSHLVLNSSVPQLPVTPQMAFTELSGSARGFQQL